MAKTFKNLPQPENAATSKRASERDFFDLTDDPQPADIAELVPTVDSIPPATTEAGVTGNHRHSDYTGNTPHIGNPVPKKRAAGANRSGGGSGSSNTGVIGNMGNGLHTSLPDNMVVKENSGTVVPVASKRDVRQTFVLSQDHLEKLRDHVHARRIGGDYNYSQKQALEEALDLLFASTAPVSPRPEQVREREQQRRERMQQGRLSRT